MMSAFSLISGGIKGKTFKSSLDLYLVQITTVFDLSGKGADLEVLLFDGEGRANDLSRRNICLGGCEIKGNCDYIQCHIANVCS